MHQIKPKSTLKSKQSKLITHPIKTPITTTKRLSSTHSNTTTTSTQSPRTNFKPSRSQHNHSNSHQSSSAPYKRRPTSVEIPFDKVPVKFTDLGISNELTEMLYQQGVVAPSEIQKLSIPAILRGGDVCITAQTGQGKTISYVLPLIQKLKHDEIHLGKKSIPQGPRALILVPTRELALQVEKTTKILSHSENYKIRSKAITGDHSAAQIRQILAGNESTKSRVLINTTEGKIRDQIRLSATIASKIINLLFKQNNWGYMNEPKKLNKKVQEQQLFDAEQVLEIIGPKIIQLEHELTLLSSNESMNDDDEGIPTNTIENDEKLQIKVQLKKYREEVARANDVINRLMNKNNNNTHNINTNNNGNNIESTTTNTTTTTESTQTTPTDTSSTTTPSPTPNTTTTTTTNDKLHHIPNWQQVKRHIKRETTRFAYTLFALANDYSAALDSYKELTQKTTKNNKKSKLQQQSTPTTHQQPFHIPTIDLEDGLDIISLTRVDPISIREVANEYVHTLALDHLRNENRSTNIVTLPVPLMRPIGMNLHDDLDIIEENDENGQIDDNTIIDGNTTRQKGKQAKPLHIQVPIHKTGQDDENNVENDENGQNVIKSENEQIEGDDMNDGDDEYNDIQEDEQLNDSKQQSKQKNQSDIDVNDQQSNLLTIDVDYVTRIVLQSLTALGPDLIQFKTVQNGTIMNGDNHQNQNESTTTTTIQKPLNITYDSISNDIINYTKSLSTEQLHDLITNQPTNEDEIDDYDSKQSHDNNTQQQQQRIDHLQRNLDILICTPSRLIQLIQWDAIRLGKLNYVVLDEADMLITSRTHIPQNLKTAFTQLTQDQKQNISKHLTGQNNDKMPMMQLIQDLQIRNGELYESMIPLLQRLKMEYEYNHGFEPHVQLPNTVFRHKYTNNVKQIRKENDNDDDILQSIQTTTHNNSLIKTQRRPSIFNTALTIVRQKQLHDMVRKDYPDIDPNTQQFQDLVEEYENNHTKVMNEHGILLPLSHTDPHQRPKMTKMLLQSVLQLNKDKQQAQLESNFQEEENNTNIDNNDQNDINTSLQSQTKSKSSLQLSLQDLRSLNTSQNQINFNTNDIISNLPTPELRQQVKKVQKLSQTIEPIQFIYTSATLSSNNTQFHQELMKINPLYNEEYAPRQLQQVTTNDALCLPTCLKQTFVQVGLRDKLEMLTDILNTPQLKQENTYFPIQTMVFCNTIAAVRAVSHTLHEKGISATAIHSGIPPPLRAANWESFFNNQVAVMVATDMASRGIHHPSIRYIINFDFPLSSVDYLHRAGRATALPGIVGNMVNNGNKRNIYKDTLTPQTEFVTINDDYDSYVRPKRTTERQQRQRNGMDNNEYDNINDENHNQNQQHEQEPIMNGLQAVVLNPNGQPIQKRGEVISFVNKADQILAHAIHEASKQLQPITALSSDKKDYSLTQQHDSRSDKSYHSNHDNNDTKTKEPKLTIHSREFLEQKDKLVRKLQGTPVYIGSNQITNTKTVSNMLREAAKDYILHRDKQSNKSDIQRRVDRHSDKRRDEAKYIQQQTEYAESMGFTKPLLSKTAKINSEYPERLLNKKIDMSLQGQRIKTFKQRERLKEAERIRDESYYGQSSKTPISRRDPELDAFKSFSKDKENNGNQYHNKRVNKHGSGPRNIPHIDNQRYSYDGKQLKNKNNNGNNNNNNRNNNNHRGGSKW